MRVVYYVSGHGFGHLTRVAETVNEILKQGGERISGNIKTEIIVVSSADESLFKELFNPFTMVTSELVTCHYRRKAIDPPGVLQLNPFDVDVPATMKAIQGFLANEREKVIQDELTFLKEFQPDFVLTDVAFAPLSAAHQLGLTSIIVSNFTWDHIYSEFLNQDVISLITKDYKLASLLFRLPGYVKIPSFENRQRDITDIPLVVRKTKNSRNKIKEMLNLSLDQKF